MDHPFITTAYYGIDWFAMLLSLYGLYKLGDKTRIGFVMIMAGALCWLVMGMMADNHPLMIVAAGDFLVSLRNYIKWSPDPKLLE